MSDYGDALEDTKAALRETERVLDDLAADPRDTLARLAEGATYLLETLGEHREETR